MKIAIIGTGISGLGCAHLLHPHHDITVYEANPYVGGHSRTIYVNDGQKFLPVDTGFIVFNKRNYPLLTTLFERLEVPLIKSDMSFGATINNGWLEYGSKSMFGQYRNLLRPNFWRMIKDILTFNRQGPVLIEKSAGLSLGQWLTELKLGTWFQDYYLCAMGAAIWSCSSRDMLDFPASSFLRFFQNHGLLTINDHPQWYTVDGGSRAYIERLTAPFKERIRTSCPVTKVRRADKEILVEDALQESATYDHVIFACHADQALRLLENPSRAEDDILGAFSYQKNTIVVHSDVSFMPRRRACWASWVYRSEAQHDTKPHVCLTYWMNQLQSLPTPLPVFITLNPVSQPKADLIHDRHEFRHPLFNLRTLKAQDQLAQIQHKDRISYAGAYQRYGFHEDGFMSAVQLAKHFGASFP